MKENWVASPRPGRGRSNSWGFVLVLAATALGSLPAAAQQPLVPVLRPVLPAAKPETAALPPPGTPAAGTLAIPQPLSVGDADRYRQIFDLQRSGQFYQAENVVGWLTDHRLLGHVLAQRYLSPGYRTSYRELALWLDRYGDQPEAWQLYQMALKRRPAGSANPRKPEVDVFHPGTPDDGALGTGSDWRRGLALWRAGNLAGAATAFERAAGDSQANDWNLAAASYWAARAHLKNREPAKVSSWLRRAAQYPHSFYGQLALRALGLGSNFDWSAKPLTQAGVDALARSAAGQRVLALIQIGEMGLAEDEAQSLLRGAGPDLASGIQAVAQLYELPSVALGIGMIGESQPGLRADADLYPVPHWQPAGGFSIDRALLFALARQESAFNPNAQSPAGASGLLQIMPGTAKALGYRTKALHDPATNLAMGQTYLKRLLADPLVGGDLFMMAVAYNAGPGTLAKWRAANTTDDALLFIESLPNQETRSFVQRVMANIWIYQQRLGQSTPTLDMVASGAWPRYQGQDETATASNGADGNGAN
jgi:soluble lytic murein transglycosylase